MSKPALSIAVAAALLAASGRPVPQSTQPPDPAREHRLEWFREAKYGMFIHWGLYAIPAGEWKGQRSLGLGEWIMNRAQIPVTRLRAAGRQFNPLKFNADEWVQLAQDAGMKYIVITSKHHDGFAMFEFEGQPLQRRRRDAVQARRAQGARRRVRQARHARWVSTIRSRRTGTSRAAPATRGTSGPIQDPNRKELKPYDQYLRGKAEPQVRELLTGYGPVALIWFDTPRMMTPERGQRFANLVRTTAADDADRWPSGNRGRLPIRPATTSFRDKASGEPGRCRPPSTTPGASAPTTPTGRRPVPSSSSCRHRQQGWQLPAERRADCERRDPAGQAQDNLRTVGRWLKMNGEAVYGAGRSPFGRGVRRGERERRQRPSRQSARSRANEWRVTTRPGKLYFTFFSEPRVPFEIPAIKNRLMRAYQLADKAPLDLKTDGGTTTFTVTRPMLDPMATVIVVEFEGTTVQR